MPEYRRELPVLPPRLRKLKLDARGFPVPWFVSWFDDHGRPCLEKTGTPDFRVADADKFRIALAQSRCWVCGGPLGVHKGFVLGPMCAINRTISEPPSHRECAIYSACACPFLTRPRMRRNETDLPDPAHNKFVKAAGQPLDRNPGVTCVWLTREFTTFRANAGNSGLLIRLGPPQQVLWFCEGRPATRAEVTTAIDSGLPSLEGLAAQDEGGMAALMQALTEVQKLLPEAA